MAKTVGTLIKEARNSAGLTQEQLAKKVGGLSASDISKAERGEKALTQEQLKGIAKATGVTQKSLLDAAKGTKQTASKKTASKKTTGSKKPTEKKEETLTATEKKMVELYRAADSNTKKAVMDLLKGEQTAGTNDIWGNLLGNAINMFSGKK